MSALCVSLNTDFLVWPDDSAISSIGLGVRAGAGVLAPAEKKSGCTVQIF